LTDVGDLVELTSAETIAGGKLTRGNKREWYSARCDRKMAPGVGYCEVVQVSELASLKGHV